MKRNSVSWDFLRSHRRQLYFNFVLFSFIPIQDESFVRRFSERGKRGKREREWALRFSTILYVIPQIKFSFIKNPFVYTCVHVHAVFILGIVKDYNFGPTIIYYYYYYCCHTLLLLCRHGVCGSPKLSNIWMDATNYHYNIIIFANLMTNNLLCKLYCHRTEPVCRNLNLNETRAKCRLADDSHGEFKCCSFQNFNECVGSIARHTTKHNFSNGTSCLFSHEART